MAEFVGKQDVQLDLQPITRHRRKAWLIDVVFDIFLLFELALNKLRLTVGH